MTVRNPLVLVNGQLAELPAGDTVNGAPAAGMGLVCETVAAGTSLTITAGYQLAVHGAYVVEGTLNIDGKLVMP